MSIEKYLEEMKTIQKKLLDYIDYETNIEEEYQNLINIFDEIDIHNNQYKIKSLFYLIVKISNNHHRESDFFSKIEQILSLFKNDMSKYFSNSELFHIFKSNKRILLFLFEEKIMMMDEFIVKKIINNRKYIEYKYPQFFQPEIQPFIGKKWFPKYDKNDYKITFNEWVEELKKELPDDFYQNQEIGEKEEEICKLIQKDLIEEFIIYVNKNFYSITSTINQSIYETNNLLLKRRNMTLIEYAVFFGSIQIFNYLRKNGAELNSKLWIYAIHGNNEEIIHFLEENKIIPSQNEELFKESIKCHHIDVTNYIQNNYLQNDNGYSNYELIDCYKYYNFVFIQFDISNVNFFFYLYKYDYYSLVFFLFKQVNLDINKKIIYILIFFYSIFHSKLSITFKIISFGKVQYIEKFQ